MPEPFTRESLVGRKMKFLAHLRLQGGYGYMYQVEGVPRLSFLDQTIRRGENAGSTRTWFVDNKSVESLDAALAVINAGSG